MAERELMRHALLSLILLVVAPWNVPHSQAQTPPSQSDSTIVRRDFHIRYVNNSNVYIDAGRDAGLMVGTTLVLKQDPAKASPSPVAEAIAPGVVARLTVVAIASTSAVCEVNSSSRDLQPGDLVSLPDSEVEKMIEKQDLGNTRQYPIIISFNEGDPLDEEVRETLPRPPLPEINQLRGRIGLDISTIQQVGQAGGTSNMYGAVFRADFTRIFGSYWNLNGYWRGNLQTNSSASQASLQNLINRTYLMSLTYINPNSQWTAGIGRLYLPWASSLETLDGAYVYRQLGTHTVAGIFGGSTPDPAAWNYDPQRQIGGLLFNAHGGNFERLHYASTFGFGIELLKWSVNRPFVFTENNISFKRYFSLYESLQIDHPTANPSTPSVGTGIGESLLSLRIQAHPRISIDLTDTYFRDVPTYDATLIGTGLLDKYLYQGINGGARIEFPRHITGYFSLGSSNDSSDRKSSLNKLFGATMSGIWKTGLTADARYSKFSSAFASGTYTTVTVSRDLLDSLHLNLQAGRYAYSSSVAATSNSKFINFIFDTNLGSRLFLESMFTLQRGGTLNYNQWTTTVGYRFNNRAASRRSKLASQP